MQFVELKKKKKKCFNYSLSLNSSFLYSFFSHKERFIKALPSY